MPSLLNAARMALLTTLLALPAAFAATPGGIAPTPAKIPRLANGRPDFSGIWQTLTAADYDLEPHSGRKDAPPAAGVVEGGRLPYLPTALATRKRNFEQRATQDPAQKCWALGVPRQVYYPEPFQLLQRERDLTLIPQRGYQIRTIHTNGTLHPAAGGNEYWLGDSRGKWEGDTLVVDVTDFNDETWLDRSGNFHSTDLHVVERWSFIDANTIGYQATVEDPQVFSRPWKLSVLLYRLRDPNVQLIENYCYTLDYDQYYPPRKE